MLAYIAEKKLILAGGIVVALAIIAAAIAAIFNTGPHVPNVKVVNFMPEGKQTVKENQQILVKFKVHNFESYDVPNVRVTTTCKAIQDVLLSMTVILSLLLPLADQTASLAI